MQVRMVAEHEVGAVVSGVYQEIRKELGLGGVPNVFKAMAGVNTDVLLQNWVAFRRTLLQGDLPRTVKEMIALVVSRENDCPYSIGLHARSLGLLGLPAGTVKGLTDGGPSDGLAPAVQSVLSFARDYCRKVHQPPTAPLEAAGFTEEEVQEVIDTILIVGGMNRFATESEVPVDQWV